MENKEVLGHVAVLLTILIWGTTFISTKVLLQFFTPVEILAVRFLLGYCALYIIYPRRLNGMSFKQELICLFAGMCGICLYYLCENIALSYTLASNVGVLICLAPLFTVILSRFFKLKKEKIGISFCIGCVIAFGGVVLISFDNQSVEFNFIGDCLAVLAALIWAIYSLLTKKLGEFGINTILLTRRVFFYGLIFILPLSFVFDFSLNQDLLFKPEVYFNFLFLGLGAYALCFVTWNFAVKILGAVKTGVYIYAVPVITVITSVLILHEVVTVKILIGLALTLLGVFIAEEHGLRYIVFLFLYKKIDLFSYRGYLYF